MSNTSVIIEIVLQYYPDTEAIYLFGSYATEYEREDSDIDIALLFSPESAKTRKDLVISDCRYAFEDKLHRTVDMINLRMVNTVFQHEIIQEGRLIYTKNEYITDEFEMITMSLYQKLNEERLEIIEDIKTSGRILMS